MTKSPKPAVSLHRSLRTRVGVLVSCSVLLVGLGFFLFGIRPMVGRIAAGQFAVASIQVEASLNSVFQPTEQILNMSHRWFGSGPPDLEHPEVFNQLFRPVLEVLPQATSIVAGTSAGEGWLLLQLPDGKWRNRMTDRQRWGDRHLFFERDTEGKEQQYWESVDYDPRKRAWYSSAMADKEAVQWTEPYTFFTTGDPGITASTHITLKDGRDFVIGMDLMLRDLSTPTINAKVGEHGIALVLTEDLRVLALPVPPPGIDPTKWLGQILQSSTDLGLAPLTDALADWRKDNKSSNSVTSYRSGGQWWLARMHSYRLGKTQLWVVTLAPEADFSPNWVPVAGLLLGGLIVMLLLVALFAKKQAERIARPLEELVAASTRIGQLDFQSETMAPSEIEEVGQLAAAYEKMRDMLQKNQQQITLQKQMLHSQINVLQTAEKKIHESEAYNKVLFSDSGIALVVLDPQNGMFIDCNQAAVNIYRLPDRASVIGLSPIDVSAPTQYDGTPSAEGVEAKMQQAMEYGSAVFEWRHRRPDGTEWDAEINLMPFRHDNRQLLQFSSQDITENKKNENKLIQNGQYQQALLENFPFLVWLKDKESRYLAVNQHMAKAVGMESVNELIGRTDFDLIPHELAEVYRAEDLAVINSCKIQYLVESRVVNDRKTWSETFKSPVLANGQVTGTVGFSRDITVRKQAEEKLQLAASVFTHAREGILIATADGTIIDVNDTFSRITGYSRDEAINHNPRILKSGLHDKAFYVALWRDLIEKGHWYGEIWNRRKNGEMYAEMLTISAVYDDLGNVGHYVALCSDITAVKEHEKQLEHIAHYDVLTTLPNRILLADRLHQAMTQGARRGQLLAVAYLDLDGFKAINDNYGHEIGDQLLIALASRMKTTLRESDTLARLGGDEFVAILLDLNDVEVCTPMLDRLLAAAAEPLYIGDLVLQVSASLGVTFYPQTEEVDADQLLRQADQSMYQAKLAGKNRYHVFDADQDRTVRVHHESLEHIRHALAAGEFVLYYQPKVNMRTGLVIGAEALIRWQHPERGILPPAVFLPVIENHPLAIAIGEWVIDSALTQMELWHAVGLDISVSVNVGAQQLQQTDFVDRLREILATHPFIDPRNLAMEVLETSALEDLSRVSQIIESCREIGVMFALDDFGTGYSSLTYLKRLSVSQLKIDQSFVHDMLDDPDDLAILCGVLSLATAFRRQVIAEGVETVEHGSMLLQLGCELAQGYGIARPMPAEDFPGWANAWCPDSVWSNLPPIDRDDMPLLFATVKYRAWIVAVESFIKGERNVLPLIHHENHFDTWLEFEGQARHGKQTAFQPLKPLHQKTRTLAVGLCELRAQGQTDQALAGLSELITLRDALLAQLQVLVRNKRE